MFTILWGSSCVGVLSRFSFPFLLDHTSHLEMISFRKSHTPCPLPSQPRIDYHLEKVILHHKSPSTFMLCAESGLISFFTCHRKVAAYAIFRHVLRCATTWLTIEQTLSRGRVSLLSGKPF